MTAGHIPQAPSGTQHLPRTSGRFPGKAAERPTSRRAWAILVVSGAALAAARIPSAAAYAHTLVTPEQRAALGDQALEDTAILVGVIGAVPVFAILLLVLAFIASALESRLFPFGIGNGKLRIGAGWITVATGSVGIGVVMLLAGAPPRIESGWRMLALLAIAVLAPLTVRPGRTLRGYRRALLVTVPLGLLLCIQ